MKQSSRTALLSIVFSILYLFLGMFALAVFGNSIPSSEVTQMLIPLVSLAIAIFLGVKTAMRIQRTKAEKREQ